MPIRSNSGKGSHPRRYQRGTLKQEVNFWKARWREDRILPAGTPLQKGDNPQPDGTILRRVHHNEIIGYLSDFRTKRMAQKELDRLIREGQRAPEPIGRRQNLSDASCVVKVGDGRGFIIKHSWKLPTIPPLHLAGQEYTTPEFADCAVVVTAAHCLPELPEILAHFNGIIYKGLLGTLDGKKSGIWAACVFVDPIADIAVLCGPDDQELPDEADAYDDLAGDVLPLEITDAQNGSGWVLSLAGKWTPTPIEVNRRFRPTLTIGPTVGGMSGSPILDGDGLAVGLVSSGTDHITASGKRITQKVESGGNPILTHALPGWVTGKACEG